MAYYELYEETKNEGIDLLVNKGNINDISSYKNSMNFVKSIKEARKFEKSHDKIEVKLEKKCLQLFAFIWRENEKL